MLGEGHPQSWQIGASLVVSPHLSPFVLVVLAYKHGILRGTRPSLPGAAQQSDIFLVARPSLLVRCLDISSPPLHELHPGYEDSGVEPSDRVMPKTAVYLDAGRGFVRPPGSQH